MAGASYVAGLISGVLGTIIFAALLVTLWLVRNGRREWSRLAEMVKLRGDLQQEAIALAEKCDDLDRRRRELEFKTPPKIPSIPEIRRDRGLG